MVEAEQKGLLDNTGTKSGNATGVVTIPENTALSAAREMVDTVTEEKEKRRRGRPSAAEERARIEEQVRAEYKEKTVELEKLDRMVITSTIVALKKYARKESDYIKYVDKNIEYLTEYLMKKYGIEIPYAAEGAAVINLALMLAPDPCRVRVKPGAGQLIPGQPGAGSGSPASAAPVS